MQGATEKMWSWKGRGGGGWSDEIPALGSHFHGILPFPHPHPEQSGVTAILQNLAGALLFSRSSASPVPTLVPSGLKPTGREARLGGEGKPGAPDLAPTSAATAVPREATVPASPGRSCPLPWGEGPGGLARRRRSQGSFWAWRPSPEAGE